MVLGGRGFFGRTAVSLLRSQGLEPAVAARRGGADLTLDAEDPAGLAAALRPGDVILDCAGPFQERSTALVAAALTVGCDLVDLADSLGYAERVLALAGPIAAAGRRVLTGCSSVSAVHAALIAASGIARPVRVALYLAPAARDTAHPGSARSLMAAVGRPIRRLRDGRLAADVGFATARAFALPPPLAPARARLAESADALLLPRSWPSLAAADFWVDPHVPGLGPLLALAARRPGLRRLLARLVEPGALLARRLGPRRGILACEVEGEDGAALTLALTARRGSFVAALAPALLAVEALAGDRFPHRGLVAPHQQVEVPALLAYLEAHGVRLLRSQLSRPPTPR